MTHSTLDLDELRRVAEAESEKQEAYIAHLEDTLRVVKETRDQLRSQVERISVELRAYHNFVNSMRYESDYCPECDINAKNELKLLAKYPSRPGLFSLPEPEQGGGG